MKITLFKKQLLVTAVIMVTFVFLGLLAAFVVAHSERDRMFASPFTSFARLVDTVASRESSSPEVALREVIEQSGIDREHISFSIGSKEELEKSEFAANIKFPDRPYDSLMIEKGIFSPPQGEVIRLKAKPDLFLVIRMRGLGPPEFRNFGKFDPPPPPGMGPFTAPPLGESFHGPGGVFPKGGPPPGGPPGGPRGTNFFVVNFVALLISVIMGSVVSVFFLFYKMREKAQLAEAILSEMQSGNLKVRFPVTKLDETGQIMTKFNKMADEIEHLVEQLKTTEMARTRLLQELAHDLRTPIASLKSFVETLSFRHELLKKDDRIQLLNLSLKEIDYFEHLVEDLLFLAQVRDPKYHPSSESVDVVELIEGELASAMVKYGAQGEKQVSRAFPNNKTLLPGDPLLLRRLFRNAFENAFSFARSQIQVSLEKNESQVTVKVADDGPGLSPDAITGFGEKRGTRIFDSGRGGRVSVGLGSVIMKAVVNAHQGTIAVRNRSEDTALKTTGAELTIKISCNH